jgi:hypothetical protein
MKMDALCNTIHFSEDLSLRKPRVLFLKSACSSNWLDVACCAGGLFLFLEFLHTFQTVSFPEKYFAMLKAFSYKGS